MKVSVADAKNKLPELIRAAEDGETVTICRVGCLLWILSERKSPLARSGAWEPSKVRFKF